MRQAADRIRSKINANLPPIVPAAAGLALALFDSATQEGAAYVLAGQLQGPPDAPVKSLLPKQVTVHTASGAVAVQHGTVLLNAGSALAMTLVAPTAGTHDGVEIDFVSVTAQAHTVTHTAGFGGGTTARDVATFGGAINDGLSIVAYNGVWYAKSTRNVTIA